VFTRARHECASSDGRVQSTLHYFKLSFISINHLHLHYPSGFSCCSCVIFHNFLDSYGAVLLAVAEPPRSRNVFLDTPFLVAMFPTGRAMNTCRNYHSSLSIQQFANVPFHQSVLSNIPAWKTKKKNSVASVRYRTIPSERPPLVGEVSASFCG
jgi:hypothetical protein